MAYVLFMITLVLSTQVAWGDYLLKAEVEALGCPGHECSSCCEWSNVTECSNCVRKIYSCVRHFESNSTATSTEVSLEMWAKAAGCLQPPPPLMSKRNASLKIVDFLNSLGPLEFEVITPTWKGIQLYMQMVGDDMQISDTFAINLSQNTFLHGSHITRSSLSFLLSVNLTLRLTCLGAGCALPSCDDSSGFCLVSGEKLDTIEKVVLGSMMGVVVLAVIGVGVAIILALVCVYCARQGRDHHVITSPQGITSSRTQLWEHVQPSNDFSMEQPDADYINYSISTSSTIEERGIRDSAPPTTRVYNAPGFMPLAGSARERERPGLWGNTLSCDDEVSCAEELQDYDYVSSMLGSSTFLRSNAVRNEPALTSEEDDDEYEMMAPLEGQSGQSKEQELKKHVYVNTTEC